MPPTAPNQPRVRPGNESHQPTGADPAGQEGEGTRVHHGNRERSASAQRVRHAGNWTSTISPSPWQQTPLLHQRMTHAVPHRWRWAASLRRGWDRVRRWPRGMQQRRCWISWDTKCLSLSLRNRHSKLMKRCYYNDMKRANMACQIQRFLNPLYLLTYPSGKKAHRKCW